MNQWQDKIKELESKRHCQNCGKVDLTLLDYGQGEGEAFTQCCHDAVCDGTTLFIFGNKEIEVRACCWAVAELKFKAQDIDVLKQKGMKRFELM